MVSLMGTMGPDKQTEIYEVWTPLFGVMHPLKSFQAEFSVILIETMLIVLQRTLWPLSVRSTWASTVSWTASPSRRPRQPPRRSWRNISRVELKRPRAKVGQATFIPRVWTGFTPTVYDTEINCHVIVCSHCRREKLNILTNISKNIHRKITHQEIWKIAMLFSQSFSVNESLWFVHNDR